MAHAEQISKRLFSTESAKAVKASKYNYINGIHYMSPYDIAGAGNLCPWASEGCKRNCLGYHSGQAGMVADATNVENKNNVRLSRDRKARQFMTRRKDYLHALHVQANKLKRRARKAGKKLCLRMNGSTDVNWLSFYAQHKDVQFAEYTKSEARAIAHATGLLPSNVHVTFSRHEDNDEACVRVLNNGGNVAVVFATKLPEKWNGYRVINGDKHDLRHLDPKNVVVGLIAKGAARNDTSGFVVR